MTSPQNPSGGTNAPQKPEVHDKYLAQVEQDYRMFVESKSSRFMKPFMENPLVPLGTLLTRPVPPTRTHCDVV